MHVFFAGWLLQVHCIDCRKPTPYTFSSKAPVYIPDSPGSVKAYITVPPIGPGSYGSIGAFSIELNIRHTYISDLQIRLTSDNQDGAVIVDRVGGSGQNFSGTQLLSMSCDDFDRTPKLSSGTAPFTGTWQSTLFWLPQSVEGTWTLTIQDLSDTDTGVLDSVILRLFSSGMHRSFSQELRMLSFHCSRHLV